MHMWKMCILYHIFFLRSNMYKMTILGGFKHDTFVKSNNWDWTIDISKITINIKSKILPFKLYHLLILFFDSNFIILWYGVKEGRELRQAT